MSESLFPATTPSGRPVPRRAHRRALPPRARPRRARRRAARAGPSATGRPATTLPCFGVSTLERWFYAYRRGGLDALRPAPRSDRGRARELTPEQRELLLDIRREHPTASVPLILRTLVADGRLAEGVVSDTTVRGCTATPGSSAARARRPHAPALAGRAPRRAVARRRVPWPDAADRQDDAAAAHPRAARRCVALRRRARGAPHRARGRHARPAPWPRCAATALPTPSTSTTAVTYRGDVLAPRAASGSASR